MSVKDTIIWLGSIAEDQRVLHSAAVSPAANRWQRGLISALAGTGLSIRMVGHWAEPMFPKGPLFVAGGDGAVDWATAKVDQTWVGYMNAPAIRARSLEKQYECAVRSLMSQCADRLLAVMSYNAYNVGWTIKKKILCGTSIPWVPIVADADGSPKGQDKLFRMTSEADAVVVLAWGLSQRWPRAPILHLDGGINLRPVCGNEMALPSQRSDFPFLYCGAINKGAGVDLLAEAFGNWSESRARLWLCGKGAVPERFPSLARDHRVTFFGACTDDKIDELAAQCYAFVNPRPTDVPDNQMNFPSKVLEYLRYGKPVVSTWTDGLDPVYRSMLTVAGEGTAQSVRDAMAETMMWTADDLIQQGEMTRHFLLGIRTWVHQAQRLRTFLERIQIV